VLLVAGSCVAQPVPCAERIMVLWVAQVVLLVIMALSVVVAAMMLLYRLGMWVIRRPSQPPRETTDHSNGQGGGRRN